MLGVVSLLSVAWGQRLQPADFQYLGAFAIDANQGGSWNTYGQRGMTFDSTGDPGNSDAFPGSLWITGHDYERQVFEISIPTPSPSAQNWSQLPRPSLLTAPIQFTSGCIGELDYFAGVEVYESSIWGSCATGYNVTGEDLPAIMWRRKLSDLSNLQGPFHAGPINDPEFHSNRQGMYLFSIPMDWANTHLDGRTLATGFSRNSHGGQLGPTLLAFDPDNPTNGYDLLWYRQDSRCFDNKALCDYPDYTACDNWSSAVWVRTATSDAVMFTGIKYDGGSDYVPGGWFCGPGFGEITFYDPEDFVARIEGRVQPWEVVPYATWRPEELWYAENMYGGAAFDAVNGYFYVIETYAGPYGTAIIHVYQTEGGIGIFADGFETGNANNWSVKVP
jgi:hypothetical protein